MFENIFVGNKNGKKIFVSIDEFKNLIHDLKNSHLIHPKYNKKVENLAYFITGFIGCVVGQPGDSALTRWQKGLKLAPRDLMRGSLAKGVSIGIFTVIFNNLLKKNIFGEN